MKKLNNISDNNPFRVPDNYFEEVNRKIILSVPDSEKEAFRISNNRNFRRYLLIAASVAGFILMGYGSIKIISHNKQQNQLSEAVKGINPDSLINSLDFSMVEENISVPAITEESAGITKSEIVDYLLLNNVEANDIYEHL